MAYGIIYKATNTLNGKVYVGHTVKTLARRKSDHAYQAKKGDRRGAFQVAILEHGGVNAFLWEQIDSADTKAELDDKEKQWIAHYKSDDPQFGYNQQSGGIGGRPNIETREKIIKAKTGMKYRGGKKASQEICQKMSIAHKNSIAVKNHINDIANMLRGKPQPKVWGEKCGKASINTETAEKIKIDIKNGMRNCDIALKYKVSKMIVTQIKTGRTWAWLQVA
jgi:group I intron endonuclease